ncbi:hypothetical protein RFI_06211 [Reticulomyxa filosa]|uniref:RNA polymerase III subunit Rpc25 domain-containing protein n=1 Tax=Reticulomyxa filosa TaxID=46433 RepID=X6NX84_RETFI|nr:hypothetical protein RFI_06211 [Reticulomyxa filosa]|eukprot:ETO30910.1 hypothetical protein RFI_06211 [Reticulomyxa filosa]
MFFELQASCMLHIKPKHFKEDITEEVLTKLHHKFVNTIIPPNHGLYEVFEGKVVHSDPSGIRVSLEFFEQVFIPHALLPYPSVFDPEHKNFVYQTSKGVKLAIETYDRVYIKCHRIEFQSERGLESRNVIKIDVDPNISESNLKSGIDNISSEMDEKSMKIDKTVDGKSKSNSDLLQKQVKERLHLGTANVNRALSSTDEMNNEGSLLLKELLKKEPMVIIAKEKVNLILGNFFGKLCSIKISKTVPFLKHCN